MTLIRGELRSLLASMPTPHAKTACPDSQRTAAVRVEQIDARIACQIRRGIGNEAAIRRPQAMAARKLIKETQIVGHVTRGIKAYECLRLPRFYVQDIPCQTAGGHLGGLVSVAAQQTRLD